MPCCTRSESYNGEVAPSDSALLTGGVANNGAKDADDEHCTDAKREPQQKVRKLRTDINEGPHECLRGELAGIGGRCTGNRSSPEQALKPAVAGSSVRPKTGKAGTNRQQECEHFYIGDEVAIVTRYRVRGKSKSERLFKRRG